MDESISEYFLGIFYITFEQMIAPKIINIVAILTTTVQLYLRHSKPKLLYH